MFIVVTASENLAAFDNVVAAHGHPFPVDGCSECGNVWLTIIARSGLNMRPEGVVQWVGAWREWRPHVFRPEGAILILQECCTRLGVCAGAPSC